MSLESELIVHEEDRKLVFEGIGKQIGSNSITTKNTHFF